MNIVLLLTLLVMVAYLGVFFIFGTRRKALFYTGGVEFLLLGAIVNSGLFGRIPDDLIAGLNPFIHVELAWIGLLYGIQFEFRRIKRTPGSDWGVMLLQSLLTMFILFAGLHFITKSLITPNGSLDLVLLCVLLAAAGSISSP